jgi:hypothetical protein
MEKEEYPFYYSQSIGFYPEDESEGSGITRFTSLLRNVYLDFSNFILFP